MEENFSVTSVASCSKSPKGISAFRFSGFFVLKLAIFDPKTGKICK